MGQIVFNGQKPKYCNLTAITTGSKKDYLIPDGEIWLIDSTNTSKTDGTGKYDYYIKGDGSNTASQLAANKIKVDDSIDISGKADKSEMSVVAGTGANADKTTITLKSGTSATVLTQHQDVSGKEDKSNKVTSFSSPTDTQYPSAKLVNDQLATKQGTISDLSTIRSGASAGATAYQKPGTGIPKTDLASAVQTSLGKADTAIQSVTVGTTTTGAAGTNASVTNTGTATEPVLSFTIPQGAQGIQGIQGIQGPQGEQGPEGPAGITGDVSDLTIRQIIDESTDYESTDVTGAKASKIINTGMLDDEEALAGILMDLNNKKANREELPNTDNLELVASAAITDLKDRIIPNEFIQEINLSKLVEDGAYYKGGLLVTDGSIYGSNNVGIHYIFANNNYHKIYAKTKVRAAAATGNCVIAFYSSSDDISVQSFISSIQVSAFNNLVEYYVNVPTNAKLISVSFGTDSSSVYEGQDIKVYRDIRKIDFRPIVDNLVTASSNKSLSSAMGADLYSDMFHNDAAHARAMQKGRPFMKNVFLDCGRKFFSVANIKRIIDKMATVDLRNLVLDYSNHQGFRFALDDMTVTTSDGITYDISQGLSADYLSQSDMDEIITYAKNKNVNVIGGLNLPGHAQALLRPIFNSSGINLDSETQQQFAAAITEKYATYFESKGAAYYYLGGDESGAHAKYGFFMNRMMHIILKHNMIPLIWNDQICRSDHGNINTPYINDGAICMFWGANNQGAQTIERNNFQQINSSMSIYWILGPSAKPTIEDVANFNINIFQGNKVVRKNIVGAQFCMWMDGVGGQYDLDNDGTDVVNQCLPLIETFGNTIMNQTGIARISTYRPTNPTAGDFFYDTTINKPIWYNGTNWVDATGTNV